MKKKIVKISFPFSEAPDFKPCDFCSLAEANKFLRSLPRPELGYYKTDFILTFEDGETYEGRYDVGDDESTLGDHIVAIAKGLNDPRHCSHDLLPQWINFLNEYEVMEAF
jgi:hypothetical protein